MLRILAGLLGLILIIGTFLAAGGAKPAIELIMPAAMNGFIKVAGASYFLFGSARARDIELVLDWRGQKETVAKAGFARVAPRLLPLVAGRLQFDSAAARDVQLNLRMIEGDKVNIDRLFRLEDADRTKVLQVYPPRYCELANVQFSFAPFTWKPIQIDSARIAFRPVSYSRAQVIGTGWLTGPLLGVGTAAIFLDLDDAGYIAVYESDSLELSLDTIGLLPLSPEIEIPRAVLPSGHVQISALLAGRKDIVERLNISVQLQGLDIHSLQYPLSLTNATGRISTDGYTVKIDGFRCLMPLDGTNAVLRLDGSIYRDASFVLDAELSNALVSDTLFSYFPILNKIPDFVSINGEADLTAQVYYKPAWSLPRIWADVTFRGQTVPLDLPAPIYDAHARLRVIPSGSAVLDEIEADIGSGRARSRITATGTFDPLREYVQVFFRSEGIDVSNELLERLPQVPGAVTSSLRIEGRLPIEGEFALASKTLFLDARARLENFSASLLDYPDVGATNINAVVQYAADRITVSNFAGTLLGGAAELDLEANLGRNNRSFQGTLNLQEVDLARIPEEYRGETTGKLFARLRFSGDELMLPALRLQAETIIRDGHIAQLPLIVSIINFLNLQLPGEVVFTSARARFTLEQETIKIQRLELYGEKLNVYVRGTIGLDGALKLRSGVDYRKPFLSEVPVLGWLFRFFTSPLRSALTTVDVRGTIEKPSISLVSVYYLTSPITAVMRFFGEEDNRKEPGSARP